MVHSATHTPPFYKAFGEMGEKFQTHRNDVALNGT